MGWSKFYGLFIVVLFAAVVLGMRDRNEGKRLRGSSYGF